MEPGGEKGLTYTALGRKMKESSDLDDLGVNCKDNFKMELKETRFLVEDRGNLVYDWGK